MEITFSFDKDFDILLDKIRSEFGSDFFELEGIGSQLDINVFNKNFFKQINIADSSVDTSSNVRERSMISYTNEVYKPFTKLNSLYIIWKKMRDEFDIETANEFVTQELIGSLYTHDLHHAGYFPYCFAYSLEPIVRNGLPFIKSGKSGPAKHLNSFLQHIIQFAMYASNSSSGAVGLPDLFVWLWYYVKKDYKDMVNNKEEITRIITQQFQILTYSLNQPIRGNQSPFTNFTLMDRNYIKAFFENSQYPDGSQILDDLEDIIWLELLYYQWLVKEREKQMLSFPVVTASLLFDYENGVYVDEDFAKKINKLATKWEDINIYNSESVDALASCCRLRSSTKKIDSKHKVIKSLNDVEKLVGTMNSIGGTSLNIGSFKVVTINLPRLSYLVKIKNEEITENNLTKQIYTSPHKKQELFLELLEKEVVLTLKVLKAIRSLLEERIEQGTLPLYDYGLMSLERQYGTIGFTGMFEAADLLGYTEDTIDGVRYTEEGVSFVEEILKKMVELKETALDNYGFNANIEQIPGEKAVVTLADKDKLFLAAKNIELKTFPMYSNQWIPLISGTDYMTRVETSQMFDKFGDGGTILHINVETEFNSEEDRFHFMMMLAKSHVIYYAINKRISVCDSGHSFYGDVCPICLQPKSDEYMRVVGFLTPVSSWNSTRRNFEAPRRKFYKFVNPK